MKLSKNLSKKEVTRSATATKHGINNEPSPEQWKVLEEMAKKVFEPCRDFVGGPLYVSSGYRSKELNQRIGGSLSSDHMISDDKTAALDLDCDIFGRKSNAQLFRFIASYLDFKQLIWEFGDDKNPDWIHVSFSTEKSYNKKEVLIAKRKGKRTVYEYWED